MKKDIEMSEISDKNQTIGTEIFDPNMPSNIDFDQKIEQHQDSFINPEKNMQPISKTIIINDQVKSFSVKGKLINKLQPQYRQGIQIYAPLQTHPVKMEDEEGSSLKKFWSLIVGHSKRELLVKDGFIYFFQKQKQSLQLRYSINLQNLFKIFVDSEQQKIRLVTRQQQHLKNKDIYPQNFILVTQMINHELNRIGLSLVE